MKFIAAKPDQYWFSPAGTEYEADAWIFRRWVDDAPLIGRAYMKVFELDSGEPVIDVHLD